MVEEGKVEVSPGEKEGVGSVGAGIVEEGLEVGGEGGGGIWDRCPGLKAHQSLEL